MANARARSPARSSATRVRSQLPAPISLLDYAICGFSTPVLSVRLLHRKLDGRAPERLGRDVFGRVSPKSRCHFGTCQPKLRVRLPSVVIDALVSVRLTYGLPPPAELSRQESFCRQRKSTCIANLLVGGSLTCLAHQLPFHCQWQDLKDLFRQIGPVIRADVALGPDGRSRGFGTVLFQNEVDAEKAVNSLNG